MSRNKTIGCTFMIAGTALGAGMLALPMVSAGSGFFVSAPALICLWALMCYTALLTLEVNIHFPMGTSFGTMAQDTLGRWGKWVAFIAMILLFYALTAAYISGGSTLFSQVAASYFHIHVPTMLTAFCFTGVFGLIIYWKTKAVDYVNRVLFTIKIAALVISISAMVTHVHRNMLVDLAHHPVYIWAALPIMFTSFGFHGSIPSILKYLGHDAKRLRFVFIVGSIIPLIIYLFWVLVTVGVLPLTGPHSFKQIADSNGSVGMFTVELSRWFHSHMIVVAINLFSNIAVTTSFLGVGLGLFDYFCDNLKQVRVAKRELAAVITFIPPLIFALVYPKGFIFALGFAAICLAVLAVLLPTSMVWAWRNRDDAEHRQILYRVAGNKGVIAVVFAIGVLIILLQILTMCHVLPQL
ncbi:MAG: tyrosine-specific transport protein [Coxiella sp. (in: Bacteria)]|nr:MAG: tyrosine-specific transport protein [Coxiella sp. (in: g-proteobacteria)]